MNASAQFDAYAATYDEDLNRALSLSGEDRIYFARGRVQWLFRRLQKMQEKPRSILDYGCGMGDTTALLRQSFEAQGGFATIIFGAVVQAIPSLFPNLQTYQIPKTVALITCSAVLSVVFIALRRINNWRRNRARTQLLNKDK